MRKRASVAFDPENLLAARQQGPRCQLMVPHRTVSDNNIVPRYIWPAALPLRVLWEQGGNRVRCGTYLHQAEVRFLHAPPLPDPAAPI